MNRIPNGTLCLLVEPHWLAGNQCTVVGFYPDELIKTVSGSVVLADVYHIAGPRIRSFYEGDKPGATRAHLLPLIPPSEDDALPRDVRTPETVSA